MWHCLYCAQSLSPTVYRYCRQSWWEKPRELWSPSCTAWLNKWNEKEVACRAALLSISLSLISPGSHALIRRVEVFSASAGRTNPGWRGRERIRRDKNTYPQYWYGPHQPIPLTGPAGATVHILLMPTNYRLLSTGLLRKASSDSLSGNSLVKHGPVLLSWLAL